MTTPVSINVLDETRRRVESLEKLAKQGLLHEADDGGTYGGMDSRVTKLEVHMEYVRSELGDIKTTLGAINGAVDGLRQEVRDTKLAAQEARLEAIATKAHSVGKTTLYLTALSIVAVILATMAFGGDRFDGGLNAASIAEQAAARALAAKPPQ